MLPECTLFVTVPNNQSRKVLSFHLQHLKVLKQNEIIKCYSVIFLLVACKVMKLVTGVPNPIDLLDDKILDWSILKQIADGILKGIQNRK